MKRRDASLGASVLTLFASVVCLAACVGDTAGAYAATDSAARFRFSYETRCPQDQVTVVRRRPYPWSAGGPHDQQAYVVRGCDRERFYACQATGGWPNYLPFCDPGPP